MNPVRAGAGASRTISVGLEEGRDGAILVHCLSLPGCVAGGGTREEALEELAREIGRWLHFLETVGEAVPPREVELEISVDEWVGSDSDVRAGVSSACFEADLVPLTHGEVTRQLRLLGDLRGPLLQQIRRSAAIHLDRVNASGWTVRRVLEELARAQWWTLTRLGASPMAEVPETTVGRLDTAMALVVQQMTGLSETERSRAVELDGEIWTPRKVLRRLLWLEWALGWSALAALEETVAG